MLERLVLRGFRSFRAETVSFDNPVFLVGHNGSGKSNLVDALAFLSDVMQSPLEDAVEKRGAFAAIAHRSSTRGRPRNLGLAVWLKDLDADTARVRYAFELRAKGLAGGFEVLREQCVLEGRDGSRTSFDRRARSGGLQRLKTSAGFVPTVDLTHLAMPLVGGEVRFRAAHAFLSAMQVCRIEPAALRALQDPEGGTRLRADGSNSASVLREIRRAAAGDREVMRELLESVVPGTVDFGHKRLGPKLTIEFRQNMEGGAVGFHAANMSDGTLRLLGLLLAVFQRPPPTVLAIEEPEITMHPGALGAVLDVLRHAGRFMQVVVTTHSPDVLDAKWIEDRHLRMVESDGGATRVRSVSGSTREVLKEHLMCAGELLRSNALLSDDGPSGEPLALFEDGAP